jgi:hypothetical protein
MEETFRVSCHFIGHPPADSITAIHFYPSAAPPHEGLSYFMKETECKEKILPTLQTKEQYINIGKAQGFP